MFYSHEILNSGQYGVATVWLVATVGSKSAARRVSKKDIQGVDVRRACEKILEPGAPIALRLQGNLLYGVSKVYEKQCTYMLSDVQKTQGHMAAFIRYLASNQLDPEAARSRPENLNIMDDPDFIPDAHIPELSADMFVLEQNSIKTSSQMSPFSSRSLGSSSGNERLPIQLELRQSSLSEPRAASQGIQGLSSAQKPAASDDHMDMPFGDEFGGPVDYGMEIDEFGNIVEVAGLAPAMREPELPALPSIEGAADDLPVQPLVDHQEDAIMIAEEPLPDAEAFPERDGESRPSPRAPEEQERQSAPAHRQRKPKMLHADEHTEISRNVLRDWQTDYLDNCGRRKRHPVTATQARQNAIHLTFGLGIRNIGQNLGVPGMVHTLAIQFSGDSLFTAYTGLETFKKSRGKRARSRGDSEEDEGRQVRPRLDDGEQQARGLEVEESLGLGQGEEQSPPEIGREAGSALDDHHSSTAPWNRGSSLMPGSSALKPDSIQFGREQSSPLRGRGSVQDIVRYSDDVEMGGIDLGGGIPNSADDSFDGIHPPAEQPAEEPDTQDTLGRHSQNFRTFVEEIIHENGERRHDEDFDLHRKWIDFDDVFVPSKTSRATAAQAFYHVLMLVTRSQMLVEQDGQDKEPFGGIHMGLKLRQDA